MLANVLGVPLGAFAGQLIGWRGPFWVLAALALASIVLIARFVPRDARDHATVSNRTELAALRSSRLWLALAACAATTGGVLATYSYVSPLLTDRTELAEGLVPLVLVGFGVGSFAGTLVGGRLGDRRPQATTVIAPVVSALLLLAVCLLADLAAPTVVLIALLGFYGLGANPVLISLAVRYAGRAATLGSALAVSAFNAGTAIGSLLAGVALDSSLGATGPAVVGTAIVSMTLIPTTALAVAKRRRLTVPAACGVPVPR